MVRSAIPLERGYLGEEVICEIPHSSHMVAYGRPTNCGPLSDTLSLGTPNKLNVAAIFRATDALEVSDNLCTTGYLNW